MSHKSNSVSESAKNETQTKSESEVDLPRLVRLLDSAHSDLIAARKEAALSKHESYEEIGDAIECVEAAFVWFHSQPKGGVQLSGVEEGEIL